MVGKILLLLEVMVSAVMEAHHLWVGEEEVV
jgi:hypothetical protein